MKSVKHTIYSLGDRGSDFARTVGSDTFDLAKRFGGGTADLAKQFGDGTVDLAKRIGPKRGLIGLAVLAAAIGGTVVLVRYLRARDAELDADDSDEAPNGRAARNRKRSRAQHRAEAAASH